MLTHRWIVLPHTGTGVLSYGLEYFSLLIFTRFGINTYNKKFKKKRNLTVLHRPN